METLAKTASIRCDLHPPLSAMMYCDHCNAFLCRICAETRPGGRVCVTCKKPCRQPSQDEFTELTARRARAKEDARLAKEAEKRIQQSSDKAKLEREARLKAEFAAKKAEWQQQQKEKLAASGAVGLPHSAQVPGRPSAFAGIPAGGVPVPQLQPLPRSSRMDDPLRSLGERAHIEVINRAKRTMIWVAIVTILVNGVAFWLLNAAGEVIDRGQAARKALMEERAAHPKSSTKLSREAQEREQEAESAATVMDDLGTQMLSRIFWAKLVTFGCFAAGCALFALYFMCETKPREATQIAFWMYAALTVVGLLLTLPNPNLISVFIRCCICVWLYRGMLAGAELQKMRDEEARCPAAA